MSPKGFDADGDPLIFGVVYQDSDQNLVEIRPLDNSNEAELILNKYLDAEAKSEHQLVLTLTDGKLGNGNFMTQSLLIVVEDINDNTPVFEPHTPSIMVMEHSATPLVLTTLTAKDRDSGIFGQVIYTLGMFINHVDVVFFTIFVLYWSLFDSFWTLYCSFWGLSQFLVIFWVIIWSNFVPF